MEEARLRTGATIGYPGWGVLYHMLLCHLNRDREEVILETGTNWGCTTIVLAQALVDAGCDGKVVTVEVDEENASIARRNIEAAKLDSRVELHVGDSQELLPDILGGREGIRFAFLDASHLYGHVMAEFERITPCLTEDALVMFDNTYRIAEDGEDPRVNGALHTISERFGGNLINLEFVSWYTPGLAIWQKKPSI
ncbi:MAG: class I SAM-dependent methyltransferase [Pseudomonadales bacterium]|nr:class I SAM-dependent methyltransferase [Pseudomonadales bacterium]